MKTVIEKGLHHVGYVVKHLDVALEALESSLGHLEYQKYSFKPMKAWCSGNKIDNYELKIAMINMGEGKTCIEIIEPVSEGYHMNFVKKDNIGGINHMCFAVDNGYDEIRKQFELEGANFVFESETEDDIIGYRRCFYAKDKLGNVVEIKETPYFRKEKCKR